MSSPVNVGDILASKYQVERVLGMGGMGVVVAAKHLILGERVAIKFLLPQALAREDVVKRFIQEGKAANRLRGEHIGRVLDVGKLEGGAPFLVMEYLDGKDLGALLRDGGPLSVVVGVDYVIQACEALAEAHSAGIIHRDLKPSNLFLIKRLDGSPSIKLIDFGISKILVPGSEGDAGEMTATAVMMGSPLYMAPEQMASARDVDGRADIWSLGIILHTVLTGAPPFRAPNVMQVYELIVQGAQPIRKTRADVPEGVEAAILKCLQRDRRQRFENVADLASALADFGPPEARFVADRIKRILSARSTRDSIPAPSSDAEVPVAVVTPAPAAAPEPDSDPQRPKAPAEGPTKVGDASPPPGSTSVSGPGSAAIDPLGTGGPWDQKTNPPSRRGRPAALIAAVAAVLIGAPVVFFVLRAEHGAGVQPVSPSAEPSASARQAALPSVTLGETPKPPAQPVQPSAEPSVLPGAAVVPSAQPSATPTAHPTTEATTSAHAHHHPVPPPIPRPPPTTKPGDLFSGQK